MIETTTGGVRWAHAGIRRYVALATLLGAALAAPAAAGQARTTTSTGLFTLQDGHSAALTLVETGGSAARPSGVVLELLGADDQLLARSVGELRPGQPVRLSFAAPRAGGEQFRARARVTTSDANLASAPILTLEVFNESTLDAFAVERCRMSFDPKGTGGEVLGNCGGCETSTRFDR